MKGKYKGSTVGSDSPSAAALRFSAGAGRSSLLERLPRLPWRPAFPPSSATSAASSSPMMTSALIALPAISGNVCVLSMCATVQDHSAVSLTEPFQGIGPGSKQRYACRKIAASFVSGLSKAVRTSECSQAVQAGKRLLLCTALH